MNTMAQSVKNQTKQIFQNIDILFDAVPKEEFDTRKGGFLAWKHFYHLLHSIDQNFIDPGNYTEPDFQKKNLHVINIEDDNKLTKEDILKYYEKVKHKIQKYLNELTDKELESKIKFAEREFTKLELILAQLRHIFFHIGYLHCCIKMEKGQTPEYIGLFNVLGASK